MDNQSTIYSKSYDLNTEVFKKISSIQQEQKEFLLSQRLADSVSFLGATAYIAQEVKTRTTLSFRLYSIRKACHQSMFYTSLMRDVGNLDKKTATAWLETLVEIAKMVNASISTVLKKGSAKSGGSSEVLEDDPI